MPQANEFHPTFSTMRDKFRSELISRFEVEEREGHKEDLLIAKLLDPRCVGFAAIQTVVTSVLWSN